MGLKLGRGGDSEGDGLSFVFEWADRSSLLLVPWKANIVLSN